MTGRLHRMSPSSGLRIEVVHHTAYRYQAPVGQSWQVAHLTPRELTGQRVCSHSLAIEPAPDWCEARADYFGNPVVAFAIQGSHRTLDVLATSRVERDLPAPDTDWVRRAWDSVEPVADRGDAIELAQYLAPSPQVPRSRRAERYARRSFRPGVAFLDALQDLCHRLHRDFAFDASATTVTTPLEAVISGRRGVCQDFAQLMIACLRQVGVPARYVSGYLVTQPPPGQARLVGADASHAWVSAWCPGQGWIDICPTNDRRIDQDFVTLGWDRDFSDVTPLRGVILGGGEQVLEARVTVTPLAPLPT